MNEWYCHHLNDITDWCMRVRLANMAVLIHKHTTDTDADRKRNIFQLCDTRCLASHPATMSWGGHISYQQATSRAQLVVAYIGSIKISSSRVGVTLWETCSNLQVLPCLLNVDGHCWRSSCNQYRSMDTTEKVIVTNITVSTAQVLLKTTLWTKEAFRAGCLVAPAHKLNCNPKPRKSNKHWTAMLQISPWDHAGERLSNHTEPNSFEWTLHRLHLMIKVSNTDQESTDNRWTQNHNKCVSMNPNEIWSKQSKVNTYWTWYKQTVNQATSKLRTNLHSNSKQNNNRNAATIDNSAMGNQPGKITSAQTKSKQCTSMFSNGAISWFEHHFSLQQTKWINQANIKYCRQSQQRNNL